MSTSGFRLLVLAAAIGLGSASCETTGEQWSFSLSRAIYGSADADSFSQGEFTGNMEHPEVLLILLFPVVIDLALMPITLPHDLLFVE